MSRPPITRTRPYTPSRGLVAGQTFYSERQYRNALARALGFASHAQRVAHPHVITNARELQTLRPSAREARRLAFKVLSVARRTGEPLHRVARDYRVSMASVKRYAGPALEKRHGIWYAKPSDKLYRQITVATTDGVVTLDTYSSKTATTIGKYKNAVGNFLRTNNPDYLKPFRNKTIQVKGRRYRFLTDPEKLRQMHESGELEGMELYEVGK